MLSKERRDAVVNNLITVSGVKRSDTTYNLLSGVLDVVLEDGFDLTTTQICSVVVDGKKLPENSAVKIVATLSLVIDLTSVKSEEVPVRRKVEENKRRRKKARRFTPDSSSDQIRHISKMVAEWRIASDGSRALAWKDVRNELKLDNDEFHKLIRLSPEYRQEVVARIKALQDRPEGWTPVQKMGKLTGLDAQGYTDEEIWDLVS